MKKKNWYFLLILSICLLFGYQTDRQMGFLSSDKGNDNVTADGTGYFAYLPQYLIYPDQGQFEFEREIHQKYPEKNYFLMLDRAPDGQKFRNKFYIGTAICQFPFYATTHFLMKVFNSAEADGYSKPYRASIALSALLFLFLGFWSLVQFLQLLKINDFAIVLTLLILALGTNLNYYSAILSSYSHVYSFGVVSLWLFLAKKWGLQNKGLTWLGFLLGMIFILRPINIVFVFILPFLFEDFRAFRTRILSLFQEKVQILVRSFVAFGIPIVLQMLVTYHQTGSFSIYTYQKEGFSNWLHPEIFNVLFSYNKGFFIYAPAVLLVMPASVYLIAKKRFLGVGSLTVSVLFVYLVSSWWCWDYGGGLGMRPLIEALPLFTIPIAYLLSESQRIFKWFFALWAVGGIIIFQTYQLQYKRHILHYEGVNKTLFWEYFMELDDRFAWGMVLKDDRDNTPKRKQLRSSVEFVKRMEFNQENQYELTHYMPFDSTITYYHLQGKVAIFAQNSNPRLVMRLYQNDSICFEKEYYFGAKLKHLEKTLPFDLVIYPGLYQSSYDSISMQIVPNAFPTRLTDVRLELY